MSSSVLSFAHLGTAIVFETIGTSLLAQSEQFTRPLPTLGMALGYICSFYFLSLALRTLPVSVAYAVWSGLGIVLIAVIGRVVFRQHLDTPAIAGMALIIAGVVVINLFSSAIRH